MRDLHIPRTLGDRPAAGARPARRAATQPAEVRKANVRDHLRAAYEHYEKTFEADRSESWALVQRMPLALLLGLEVKDNDWKLAQLNSLLDIDHPDERHRTWANSNLMELNLIRLLLPADADLPVSKADAAAQAVEYAEKVVAIAGVDTVDTWSARQQMIRYAEIFDLNYPEVKDLARRLVKILR